VYSIPSSYFLNFLIQHFEEINLTRAGFPVNQKLKFPISVPSLVYLAALVNCWFDGMKAAGGKDLRLCEERNTKGR